MSILDTNIIDAIGIDKDIGNVTLFISDHLDWSNEMEHLLLLQEKINSYLRFVESSEIYETYPEANGRDIEIKIYAKYSFSEKGMGFFNMALKTINDAGFNLRLEIVQSI